MNRQPVAISWYYAISGCIVVVVRNQYRVLESRCFPHENSIEDVQAALRCAGIRISRTFRKI